MDFRFLGNLVKFSFLGLALSACGKAPSPQAVSEVASATPPAVSVSPVSNSHRTPASSAGNGKAYFQKLTDEVVGHYGDAFGWSSAQKDKISAALMYLYGRECGYDRMNYTPRDSDGLPKWGPAQFGKNFAGHYGFLAGVLGHSPELAREMRGVPTPNDIHDVRTVTACVLNSMLSGHDIWGSGNGKPLQRALRGVHNPMSEIRARIRAARRG